MSVGHWETCPTCNGSGVVQPAPLPAFDNAIPVIVYQPGTFMRVCTEADLARAKPTVRSSDEG